MNKNQVINNLIKIVSKKNIISNAKELLNYNKDWRGFYNYNSICLVFPKNRNEISKILKLCFKNNINLSKLRWTLDTAEDLHVIEGVCKYFYPRQDFEWQEILKLYKSDRNLFKFNKHLDRNYITNL